ncbi:MAG: glycosyltransferase [Candidatus Scalindua sp.]|jgi:hypothetical protein|nr:glycosyltransferase [Candidatus Scalindua sp.]
MDIILVTNNKDFDTSEIEENISKEHNLIFTGLDDSASANRNKGLNEVKSDIYIMMDDDMEGFYEGWVEDLIRPMMHNQMILIVSARLMNPDGTRGHMMGDNKVQHSGTHDVLPSTYKGHYRIPTACLAVRRNSLRYNEGFIGSGYEDTDYMNRINIHFNNKRIMINNDCELIHNNIQKNQGGKYFEHNKKLYLSLYPDDTTVTNQRDWTQPK